MFLLITLLLATPQVAEDQYGRIHKVYSQDGEIYYQIFDGEKWSKPINLSNSPKDQSHDPVIEIKGEIVTVKWKEEHEGKTYILRRRKLLNHPLWKLPEIIDSN